MSSKQKIAAIVLGLCFTYVYSGIAVAHQGEEEKISLKLSPEYYGESVYKEPDNQARKQIRREKQKGQQPTIIKAEYVFFDNRTGAVSAHGDVSIAQGNDLLTAEELTGNYNDGEAVLGKGGKYINLFTRTDLTVGRANYNYKTKRGQGENISGRAGNKFIKAEHLELYPEKIVGENGRVTRCPGINPDYYAQADTIEIYPNEKMIAHNIKVYVKGKLIYTQDRYVAGIGSGKSQGFFPRFGYDSDDGIEITKRLTRPLNRQNTLFAYADIDYYTRSGFKPTAGIIFDDKNWQVDLSYGHMRDEDANWMKKLPQLKALYKTRRISDTIFNYRLEGIYGKWRDREKSSWHKEVGVYIHTDPLYLFASKSWWINMGTSYQHINESYDNSSINVVRYNATLTKRVNDRFLFYGGYYHASQAKKLFNFDNDYLHKEWRSGFVWQITQRDRLRLRHRYDLPARRTYDIEYSWLHNLHCVEIELRYSKKDHRTSVHVGLVDF